MTSGKIAGNYKISAVIELYYEVSVVKASVNFFGGRKHQKWQLDSMYPVVF